MAWRLDEEKRWKINGMLMKAGRLRSSDKRIEHWSHFLACFNIAQWSKPAINNTNIAFHDYTFYLLQIHTIYSLSDCEPRDDTVTWHVLVLDNYKPVLWSYGKCFRWLSQSSLDLQITTRIKQNVYKQPVNRNNNNNKTQLQWRINNGVTGPSFRFQKYFQVDSWCGAAG